MAAGEDLRGLMRFVPHNVAVLTLDHDGNRMGVTISSLVSLSLDPPLIGVSIGKDASCYVRERGGRYDDEVQRAMMGMSSREWSRYLHESAGVPDEPDAINTEVVRRMLEAYQGHLPLIDGAVDAVRRLAGRWPLGLASSSNRPLIDAVLDVAGLAPYFDATVSSEEVPRGKPAPDVYLEAGR